MPLQVFVIGNNAGIGLQGAVYRFQITVYGDNFFPITREIVFVLDGIYTGKTALSIILWAAGTSLLACNLIYSFVHLNEKTPVYYDQIALTFVIASLIYIGSCIAQYGFYFKGPAGISIPIGIFLILVWIGIYYWYRNKNSIKVS